MEAYVFSLYFDSEMSRMIVVVLGLPGSGKSYFAEKFAEVIGAHYISSDQVRVTLFEEKDYSLRAKEKVYHEMLRLAKDSLKNENDVVLDGTFYLKKWRGVVRSTFERIAKCYFIEVQASEALIKKRIQKKRFFSDADFGVYQQLKRVFQPMKRPHLELDSTNENIEEMIKISLDYIQLNKEI
ncbi:P-loop nucleotide/nucleoside kinase family protein [Ekhidna sp.]